MRGKFFLIICLFTSCGFFKTPPSNEPDLGTPSKQFDVNIQGNEIYTMLNLPITNDTIKNLIIQLGKHSYSTSRDQYNPYARTGMYLYYEFEGIRLSFNGPDAGTNKKEEVEKLIREYRMDPYFLEQITIEPAKYKGILPMGIKSTDGPIQIEEKLGLHDEHFQSNNDVSRRVEYIYPNHGLDIRFNFFPGDLNPDSTMYLLIVTDSVAEMKRYPTKFPKYQDNPGD
jgi:hypothetical protein